MTGTVTEKIKKPRPLSPHLQIYKPQITSVSSILHRMSGIALTLGLFLVTWGLIALANGRESYEFFMAFCVSIPGQILLLGWSAAFFYHLCTGIRHFILDSGFLFEKKNTAISGYIVLIVSFALTVATWAIVYCDGGAL